jgi:hypothetical protein
LTFPVHAADPDLDREQFDNFGSLLDCFVAKATIPWVVD